MFPMLPCFRAPAFVSASSASTRRNHHHHTSSSSSSTTHFSLRIAANRPSCRPLPSLPSLVHAWQGTSQTITSPEWAAAALNIGRSGGSREKLSVASHFPLHLPFPTPTKGTFQRHLDLNGGCWLQPDTKQSPIAIHEDPVCTTPARDRFPGPRSRYIRQLTVWR